MNIRFHLGAVKLKRLLHYIGVLSIPLTDYANIVTVIVLKVVPALMAERRDTTVTDTL